MQMIYSCYNQKSSESIDEVVTYSMRLTVSCLIYKPELLSCFYSFPDLENFIIKGILICKVPIIRNEISEGFYQLCYNIISVPPTIPLPHSYFLKLLQNHFPNHLTTNIGI